ncbi:MAG: PocR ligand-binding domain-containing protein, partial [Candidatus Limivicinus sp.]
MDYKLEDIFNLKKVNQILERIASTFDVAVVMVDYEGVPVVSSHNFRLFCLAARSNPEERKRCVKCDVFAGLEAVRLNRPLLYCCHNNIVNASVPIVVGDNYLGAILLGQVIIEDSSEKIRVPSLLSGSDSSETWRNNRLNEYIDDLYEQVPKIEYSKLEKLALLIDSFTQYTIEQAVAMQRNRQNYEHVLRCASPSVGAVQDSAAYGDTVKSHSP